jgi:hypothetical protein
MCATDESQSTCVASSVKRDSSGCVNLRAMCPTFQPGLRFEWRYTIPERVCVPTHERCVLDTQRFNEKMAHKRARAAA